MCIFVGIDLREVGVNGKGGGGEWNDVWVTSTPHAIASLVPGVVRQPTCNNNYHYYYIALGGIQWWGLVYSSFCIFLFSHRLVMNGEMDICDPCVMANKMNPSLWFHAYFQMH